MPAIDGSDEIKAFVHEFAHTDMWDVWLEGVITSPLAFTLLHGDARAENFFFNAPIAQLRPKFGASVEAQPGQTEMRVIDFQLVKEGFGASDLLYFMCSSLTAETRRAHELELFQLYHETMLAEGVTDYTMADVLSEVVMALPALLLLVVIQCNDASPSEPGAQELVRITVERTWALMQDYDIAASAKRMYTAAAPLPPPRYTPADLATLLPAKYVQLTVAAQDGAEPPAVVAVASV
jgi:hypothetical protein